MDLIKKNLLEVISVVGMLGILLMVGIQYKLAYSQNPKTLAASFLRYRTHHASPKIFAAVRKSIPTTEYTPESVQTSNYLLSKRNDKRGLHSPYGEDGVRYYSYFYNPVDLFLDLYHDMTRAIYKNNGIKTTSGGVNNISQLENADERSNNFRMYFNIFNDILSNSGEMRNNNYSVNLSEVVAARKYYLINRPSALFNIKGTSLEEEKKGMTLFVNLYKMGADIVDILCLELCTNMKCQGLVSKESDVDVDNMISKIRSSFETSEDNSSRPDINNRVASLNTIADILENKKKDESGGIEEKDRKEYVENMMNIINPYFQLVDSVREDMKKHKEMMEKDEEYKNRVTKGIEGFKALQEIERKELVEVKNVHSGKELTQILDKSAENIAKDIMVKEGESKILHMNNISEFVIVILDSISKKIFKNESMAGENEKFLREVYISSLIIKGIQEILQSENLNIVLTNDDNEDEQVDHSRFVQGIMNILNGIEVRKNIGNFIFEKEDAGTHKKVEEYIISSTKAAEENIEKEGEEYSNFQIEVGEDFCKNIVSLVLNGLRVEAYLNDIDQKKKRSNGEEYMRSSCFEQLYDGSDIIKSMKLEKEDEERFRKLRREVLDNITKELNSHVLSMQKSGEIDSKILENIQSSLDKDKKNDLFGRADLWALEQIISVMYAREATLVPYFHGMKEPSSIDKKDIEKFLKKTAESTNDGLQLYALSRLYTFMTYTSLYSSTSNSLVVEVKKRLSLKKGNDEKKDEKKQKLTSEECLKIIPRSLFIDVVLASTCLLFEYPVTSDQIKKEDLVPEEMADKKEVLKFMKEMRESLEKDLKVLEENEVSLL